MYYSRIFDECEKPLFLFVEQPSFGDNIIPPREKVGAGKAVNFTPSFWIGLEGTYLFATCFVG